MPPSMTHLHTRTLCFHIFEVQAAEAITKQYRLTKIPQTDSLWNLDILEFFFAVKILSLEKLFRNWVSVCFITFPHCSTLHRAFRELHWAGDQQAWLICFLYCASCSEHRLPDGSRFGTRKDWPWRQHDLGVDRARLLGEAQGFCPCKRRPVIFSVQSLSSCFSSVQN